jgi:ribosomal protein L37AE/L43A
MTAHAKKITGECPKCRAVTRHRHIGSDLYRCDKCSGMSAEAEIKQVDTVKNYDEAKQRGLFD